MSNGNQSETIERRLGSVPWREHYARADPEGAYSAADAHAWYQCEEELERWRRRRSGNDHPLSGVLERVNESVQADFAGAPDAPVDRTYYDLRVRALAREASAIFSNGRGDGGRAAMAVALQAAIDALENTPGVDESAAKPLQVLLGALGDLNCGIAHPALQLTKRRGGRSPYSGEQSKFIINCVIAKRMLIRTGLEGSAALALIVKHGQAAAELIGLSARRAADGSTRVLTSDRIAKWEERQFRRWELDPALRLHTDRCLALVEKHLLSKPKELVRLMALHMLDPKCFAHLGKSPTSSKRRR